MRFELPPRGTFQKNSDVDPLEFYYKPLVGKLFSARLNIALDLLKGRFHRLLEIGYGSGILIPTLDRLTDELHGVDLEPPPAGTEAALAKMGARLPIFYQADVRTMPFANGFFDGVVALSIFEHLKPDALHAAMSEVARILEPGGQFLIGCPAVHRAMNTAFRTIGFRGIEDHHFSSFSEILSAGRPHFTVVARATLPQLAKHVIPLGWAPYNAVLLRRI